MGECAKLVFFSRASRLDPLFGIALFGIRANTKYIISPFQVMALFACDVSQKRLRKLTILAVFLKFGAFP